MGSPGQKQGLIGARDGSSVVILGHIAQVSGAQNHNMPILEQWGKLGLHREEPAARFMQPGGQPSPTVGTWAVIIWECFWQSRRHGSNYKANIYTNMKTCVFSLPPPTLLPLSLPLMLRGWRFMCGPTCTHLMLSCLSSLMPSLWNEIGSNSFCDLEKRITSLRVFILMKVEMGWGKGCSVENKLQYKCAWNSLLFFVSKTETDSAF